MTVPTEFPTSPGPIRIAFIAEAPGFEEVIAGRPLVGPSGSVFNAALRAADIDRSAHMIGNVFSEKAADNDTGPWMQDAAVYGPEFARLTAELTAFSPNVIVPMGGTALWAFTEHTAISKFRGAVLPATRIVPGAKLLPTYHPAAVMRQWKLLPVMVRDFVRAAAEAVKGPSIVYPEAHILLDPSASEVIAFLKECAGSPLTAVDIETGWGQITCIGFAPDPTKAMCVPFVDLRRPTRSHWLTVDEEVKVWTAIKRFMEGPSPKLGQNFLYDAFWLWDKMGIASVGYLHDTRLMHHALYPEMEKSLAFMAASYTDLGAFKHWSGGYSKEKRDDN